MHNKDLAVKVVEGLRERFGMDIGVWEWGDLYNVAEKILDEEIKTTSICYPINDVMLVGILVERLGGSVVITQKEIMGMSGNLIRTDSSDGRFTTLIREET